MNADPLTDFSRLCVHTITTKGWDLDEAVEHYAKAGVSGITVWRQWLEGKDPAKAGDLIRSSGLESGFPLPWRILSGSRREITT
jgi:hypothetical protein